MIKVLLVPHTAAKMTGYHYALLSVVHSLLLFGVFLILKHWVRQPMAFKWLLIVLLFSFSCDLASSLTMIFKWNYSPNVSSNIHTLINPFLISFFFFYLIHGKKIASLLIAFNIANLIFTISIWSLNKTAYAAYNTLTEGFLILSLCLIWYNKLLKNLPSENIQKLPMFWIVTGFFLPTSGYLVIFSIASYMMEVMHDNLWALAFMHNFLAVLGNALIAYGIWLQHKQFQPLQEKS